MVAEVTLDPRFVRALALPKLPLYETWDYAWSNG